MELIGTFEDRTCVYIVMEECRGGDLESLLEVLTPHTHLLVAPICCNPVFADLIWTYFGAHASSTEATSRGLHAAISVWQLLDLVLR